MFGPLHQRLAYSRFSVSLPLSQEALIDTESPKAISNIYVVNCAVFTKSQQLVGECLAAHGCGCWEAVALGATCFNLQYVNQRLALLKLVFEIYYTQ